jgi:hypothetical protein
VELHIDVTTSVWVNFPQEIPNVVLTAAYITPDLTFDTISDLRLTLGFGGELFNVHNIDWLSQSVQLTQDD